MDSSTEPVVSTATAAEAKRLLPQLLLQLPAAEQTRKLNWLMAALESLPPQATLTNRSESTRASSALSPATPDGADDPLRVAAMDRTTPNGSAEGSTEQASALDYLSGLLVARPNPTDPPQAVVWVHPAPGRTALVAAPQALRGTAEHLTSSADPVELLWQTRLLQQAARWAEASGAEMLQAVAPPDDETFQWALTQAGIPKLVDLVFVASPPLPRPETRSTEIEIETDLPSDSGTADPRHQFLSLPPDGDRLQRWYRLLEATYVDSLDCPAINGQRSLVHTVAGYQATGHRWDPGWVMLTSAHQADLGGFILADHPDADFFELIYFGVVPQARGCGLGRKILQQALSLAAQAGRSRLIAAVDRQNLPALRVYAAADFTALEQRTVFARFFTLKTPVLDTPVKIR